MHFCYSSTPSHNEKCSEKDEKQIIIILISHKNIPKVVYSKLNFTRLQLNMLYLGKLEVVAREQEDALSSLSSLSFLQSPVESRINVQNEFSNSKKNRNRSRKKEIYECNSTEIQNKMLQKLTTDYRQWQMTNLVAVNLHDRRPCSISASKISKVTENGSWF